MKNIGLFCLLIGVLLTACKSKKTAIPTHGNGTQGADSTLFYKQLGEKVNIQVSPEDNTKLYVFVADWLGTPHKIGKCTKNGVDCSCFVKLLYETVYAKNSPRTAAEMYKTSKKLERKGLEEGDLVFFTIKSTRVSHVGVYLKNGWFAHVSTSKGVMINNLSEKYYQQYYAGAGRI
jgi:lipoprotein Spr